MKRTLLKFLPLIILVVGGGAFMLLVMGRPAPERRDVPYLGPLVEVIEEPASKVQIVVDGQGTVRPTDQIDLVPQVAGIAVWKAAQLEAGGFFARGDLLLRVDPRDYELAVTRAEAVVARSRYQLDLAREEAAVAGQEWELVQKQRTTDTKPNDLVLKLPQVRAAEADLQASQAQLDEARLRLSRTEIYAPFAGRVRKSGFDVGQYIGANQPVAQIYSIERAEIVVPVPDEDMAWFDLPMNVPGGPLAEAPAVGESSVLSGAGEGPQGRYPGMAPSPVARVSTEYAGRTSKWEGRVVRAEAEVDARTRMMRLVIQVEAPYAVPQKNQAPLLVGMFVDVEILGTEVEGVRTVPRLALREGGTVWVVDPQGVLHMRPAQVVRMRESEVLARFDMQADERVVVSQLSGATDGMKVRPMAPEGDL
jgi:RND family efflux transporter MFP subunit